MSKNKRTIVDEYTDRKDLTRVQKFRLRHPEYREREAEYTKKYLKQRPEYQKQYRSKNREKVNADARRWQRKSILKNMDYQKNGI